MAGQKSPATQAVGADAPAGHDDPAGQVLMAVLDMMEPPGQNDPAGHRVHAPWEEYDPGRQVHEARDGEPGADTELAGQAYWTPAMQ